MAYHNGGNKRPGGRGASGGNKQSRSGRSSKENEQAADKYPQENATAPYNFVPLPERVLPAPLNAYQAKLITGTQAEWRDAFREYLDPAKHKLLSGAIELTLTTRTPMFIGGNEQTQEEFYAPNGEPLIPGSTLRGFTKNLLKIISCGAMRPNEDFYDRHIYYRCLMAPGKARYNEGLYHLYKDKMSSDDGKNAKPGFLVKIKDSDKYYIYPTVGNRVNKMLLKDFVKDNGYDKDTSEVYWKGSTAYCVTGHLSKKTRLVYMDTMRDLDKSRRLEVPDAVINEYRDDKKRDGVNLLDEKSGNVRVGEEARKINPLPNVNISSIVPCFYFLSGREVKSFGHGQSFRVPYDRSIGDAVSIENKADTIDFADAIFGRIVGSNTWRGRGLRAIEHSKSWASRVFFEDARLIGQAQKAAEAKKAHPLMQPNPTSFQLYLQQNKDNKELMHWDSDGAKIRGYKLYWHSADTPHQWQANEDELKLDKDKEGDKALLRPMRPLLSGNEFRGRIRFENLHEEELGALLKVFNLATPERKDIAYKLGHGKSIGLGSVSIKAELLLEDEARYQVLFDENGWRNSQSKAAADGYIKAYEEYVAAQDCTKAYEDITEALRIMLDYSMTQNQKWAEATSAMSPPTSDDDKGDKGSFMKRSILPTARTVVEQVRGQE